MFYTLSPSSAHSTDNCDYTYDRRVRTLGAYTDDRPFSIELVSAVLRQSNFIDKMHGFAWTEPTYFDDTVDEVVLVHAIARYHA